MTASETQERPGAVLSPDNRADRYGDEFSDRLDFELPPELEASEPPEARGLRRDAVRLLVSSVGDNRIQHTSFSCLPAFLRPGDLLVINTSATMNAALAVTREDGSDAELHLSTRLPGGLWSVELRTTGSRQPVFVDTPETLALPAGGIARLLVPCHAGSDARPTRLWLASLDLPVQTAPYLEQQGFPIRYSYVRERWPLSAYQTVYATETGSAEMPSAGRAFTPELLTALIAHGVRIAPLVLHTGVASLEADERPYDEPYRVPAATAQLANATREMGGLVIAVGTTVVRALETVTDEAGIVHPGSGWTDVVVTPARGTRGVDGLLTGWHEPRSSHLAMLEAIAGRAHLKLAYQAALATGYLWHEFGDLHLLLP
ncbi:MAG TPA: S-adenosylmethionine:tRNA ribosyltransferase-isomerase [Chloroflexota bacterium]|nr:S-adenosylmethionine:tRNA ribosyltransferase-isomerase [Chloroflexota bacterium]